MKANTILKRVLLVNAIFSSVNGVLIIILNGYLQDFLGFSVNWLLPTIGGGLITFGAFIIWLLKTSSLSKSKVRTISLMDGSWVFGSAILIVFGTELISSAGIWLVSVVAVIVGTFALLQQLALKKV